MADEVANPHANQEIFVIRLRTLGGYQVKQFFYSMHLARMTGKPNTHAIVVAKSTLVGWGYHGVPNVSSEK